MSLSLCMIVKNEENNLNRCLNSVKDIADEMIIVDTGSTDSTIKIAENYGAKVFFYKWDNSFANARNFSLEKASKDWILIMDADDELEKEGKNKIINLISKKNNIIDIYCGETLSYAGETPGVDIYTNLNIRFIKNGKGYKFKGDIHEQISLENGEENVKKNIYITDIRFYHYGYLNSAVKQKNKRERNMNIIEKVLKNNPNDAFTLYNMGSEYSAMGNFSEALKYYEKSYKKFNPSMGFSCKLILKMISCYEFLGKFHEELKLIDEGLKYYPNITDLEFHKAIVFFNTKKYDLSILSLKKCIDMGESPIKFKDLAGIGSFRAYYFLSIIYYNVKDCDTSYYYLDKSLKINHKFPEAILKMSEIMFIKNISVEEIETKFASYFNDDVDENINLLLSDIFFNKNIFSISYKYVKKAEAFKTNSPKIDFYKGKLLFYLKNFKEALNILSKIKTGSFYNESIYYSILCEIFNNNFNKANELLDITMEFDEIEKTIVYTAFKDIMQGNKYNLLIKDKEASEKFTQCILNLLEILLKLNSSCEFEKAIQLLDLINDDSVLLLLGKLYYRNGYFKFAYTELLRSIKIYKKIDIEGLDIMKCILLHKNIN